MRQFNLMAIRRKIEQAIATCPHGIRAGGWGVVPGDVRFEATGRPVCPLGALILGKRVNRSGDQDEAAARLLGVSERWIGQFINGVDLHGAGVRAGSWAYQLGRNFRHQLGLGSENDTSTPVGHPGT